MPYLQDSTDFRPELLSVREREVVDLAIRGATDAGIAHELSLSVSTVNSYWVRVRGKVGQLSRTEIVSKMLQVGFRTKHDGLVEEVRRLEKALAEAQRRLARSDADGKASDGVSWHLLALHFVPAAVVVAKSPGEVVYANIEAERLFHAEPGALVGREVCELTVPQEQEEKRQRIRAFMEAGEHGRLILGVDEPSFGLDGDGGNFRATISVEGFDAPEGFMGVFTVREFLGDIEAVLRTLRKPLAVG